MTGVRAAFIAFVAALSAVGGISLHASNDAFGREVTIDDYLSDQACVVLTSDSISALPAAANPSAVLLVPPEIELDESSTDNDAQRIDELVLFRWKCTGRVAALLTKVLSCRSLTFLDCQVEEEFFSVFAPQGGLISLVFQRCSFEGWKNSLSKVLVSGNAKSLCYLAFVHSFPLTDEFVGDIAAFESLSKLAFVGAQRFRGRQLAVDRMTKLTAINLNLSTSVSADVVQSLLTIKTLSEIALPKTVAPTGDELNRMCQKFPKLKSLSVTGASKIALSQDDPLLKCSSVEFYDCEFGSFDISTIANVSWESVLFSHCELSESLARCITLGTRIERLRLLHCGGLIEDWLTAWGKLPLKELQLSGVTLTRGMFEAVAKQEGIESLSLRDCTVAGWNSDWAIAKSSLKVVDLSGTVVEPWCVTTLRALESLECIRLSRVSLQEIPARLELPASVRAVWFNSITWLKWEHYGDALAALTQLTYLDLSNSPGIVPDVEAAKKLRPRVLKAWQLRRGQIELIMLNAVDSVSIVQIAPIGGNAEDLAENIREQYHAIVIVD